jgi:hypothetical protein
MAMPTIAARSSNSTFFMCCYLLGTAQLASMAAQPASAKSRCQCSLFVKFLNKTSAAKGNAWFNIPHTITLLNLQSLPVASLSWA